jgi:integrase
LAIPLKFTKRAIEKLPVPKCGRDSYRDYDDELRVCQTSVTGLQLTVSSNATVSFVLCKKFKGKTKKITIGRFPDWTVEQARIRARELITEMNRGIDPLKARRAERERGVTVAEAFSDYLDSRDTKLAQTTSKTYGMILSNHLADWKSKPMKEITEEMVERKHRLISRTSVNSATSTMKVFRAVFNYSKSKYKDMHGKPLLSVNPVELLSKQRLWSKPVRRQSKIRDSELPSWFKGIALLKSDSDRYTRIAAHYFELLLFTGLRKTEASVLRIEDVDFEERAFTLHKTKNGKSLTLPMSDHTECLLRDCCGGRKEGYVFEGARPCGHINEPRKELELVKASSGLKFSCHDLRRTFISIAESLDVSEFAIKQLVNHSPGTGVTAGYVQMDLERIRRPMQRVTDHILQHSNSRDVLEVA